MLLTLLPLKLRTILYLYLCICLQRFPLKKLNLYKEAVLVGQNRESTNKFSVNRFVKLSELGMKFSNDIDFLTEAQHIKENLYKAYCTYSICR